MTIVTTTTVATTIIVNINITALMIIMMTTVIKSDVLLLRGPPLQNFRFGFGTSCIVWGFSFGGLLPMGRTAPFIDGRRG